MASIDHRDRELLTAIERDYARILREVVTQIFDDDVEIADSFKQSLEGSPLRERLLALHESPLEVAATLTGRPIDERMRGQYDRLLADVRSEYSQAEFGESDDAHDRPPVEFIGYILHLLGYEPVHRIADEIQVWTLSTSLLPKEFMRPIVLTPLLAEQRFGPMVVGKNTIRELLDYVFMRRLSESDFAFILKALLSTPKKA